ncbi:uncharacterized protein LOC123704634 [Colias croceus]|uniref:uncharacterized protein LOC123704634 n=1 Tax=Colias crocea TaxID=72248 RepID=UPI001E280D2A|nr:uncharacterized protein LOC123704634 [Colias croceus]XP_045508990.1 uncharacterized protein LOC123704634 [Colias croceus]XP_045508991.1 uncharacterized protein LOC123704634 [Colias croceus]
MSTLNSQTDWTNIPKETLYEKCRNITEEIYKRINITFQVKKLENSTQSDVSEQSDIGSSDLSNETDLFACDKSSISSSTELENLELGSAACEKYININNNEETKEKKVPIVKRPKKRFRKRIKKKQVKDSDGSSDEAPLRGEGRRSASPRHDVALPNIVIVTSDLKYKIKQPQLPDKKPKDQGKGAETKDSQGIDNSEMSELSMKDIRDSRVCKICNLTCRGERGLRRHMKMSHLENTDETTLEQRN